MPADTIVEAAQLYATTPKAGIFYTLGITEHTVGTANVMNLANLAMVTGHIGFPNAGVNPMRGQNNVQGSCDMGALPNSFPGYPSVMDFEAQKKFTEMYGVQMPQDMGLNPRLSCKALPECLQRRLVDAKRAETNAPCRAVLGILSGIDCLYVCLGGERIPTINERPAPASRLKPRPKSENHGKYVTFSVRPTQPPTLIHATIPQIIIAGQQAKFCNSDKARASNPTEKHIRKH